MKKICTLYLLLISFTSLSFSETLSVDILSPEECKEYLLRFYRDEVIDDEALANSVEKLESIISSYLETSFNAGVEAFQKDSNVQKESNEGASFLQELCLLYLEHSFVIFSIYDIGGMKKYSTLIKKIKLNVELFMNAIKPNSKIYLKYADLLYLSLAHGNIKAIHVLPVIYRKILLLDKDNKEALIKLSMWYIFPSNENTSNFNGFIEDTENFIDELEEVDLFNACLWYSIYYMKNYNEKKGFEYLQKANKIFPHHLYVAHLWNNYKNGIFSM